MISRIMNIALLAVEFVKNCYPGSHSLIRDFMMSQCKMATVVFRKFEHPFCTVRGRGDVWSTVIYVKPVYLILTCSVYE